MTIATIWEKRLLSEIGKGKKVPDRRSAQQKVIEVLKRLQPDLLAGKANVQVDRKGIAKIETKLQNALPFYPYKQALQFLNDGLNKGRRTLGWEVPDAEELIVVVHERAPVTPGDFAGLEKLRSIEMLFLDDLKAEPPADRSIQLG